MAQHDLNNALQAIATNNSGTSAPSTTFANQWFYNTSSNKLFIRNEANSAFIEVATLDQTNGEWQITTGQISAKDGDGIVFKTDDGTTRVTLDDSGNFLVGKASADSATNGIQLLPNGISAFGRASNEPLRLNRNSDFGEILRCQKDGATSGSLGIQSTGFFIDGEAAHAGLRFAGNEISPRDDGADADGTVSLGESDKRFQNLYLSGGVIFDAVAGDATSNTLGDYEEGTWTPVSPDVTLSGIQTSTYTKIGRMVFVQAKFTFPTSSSGTTARVNGLPFNVDGNGTNSQYNISSGEHTFGSYITCPAIPTTSILFRPNGGTSASYATVSGKTFRLAGWYET